MHEHAHQCKYISLRCFSNERTELAEIFISILQIFNNELFGAVAEEKEVKGIVSKLMEARHSKSMDSYELLAQFCSKESITSLILPLKEVSWEKLLNINLKLLTLRKRWFDVTLLVVSALPEILDLKVSC